MQTSGVRILKRLPSWLGLSVFVLFALIPFLWLLTASLEPATSLNRSTLSLIPHPLTFDNYGNLLHPNSQQQTDFPRYFVNSVIVVACTVVLALLVAVPAAYGFSRFRFPGRQAILYGILVQSVFPLINFLIPLYIVMRTLHLANTYPSLVIGYLTFSLPLNIWLLKGFFDGIPPDMEIASRLDGASRWRAFIEIALPPALPGIMATAIYTFILAWDEYLYALTMVSSSSMRTLPLGLFAYFSEGTPNWSGLSATAIAMSIPVVAVFLILQRYFITALTKGALKY
jgi:multiple sugar transport system permease protein